jgi:hypothetical protein
LDLGSPHALGRPLRTLIPAEVGSALMYGYLGASLPWNSAFAVTQGLYFVAVVIVATVATGLCQLIALLVALQHLYVRDIPT